MDKAPVLRAELTRISTGVPGLDYILCGGLPRHRLHLIQGDPGVGKTTLGLQFLMEGVRQGEPVLYVTLSETRKELEEVSHSHGWSLDGIEFFEPRPAQEAGKPGSEYTLFHPSELELGQATGALLQAIDKIRPARLVVDSLSELRLLARDPLRYRRQVLALKQFLAGRHCTALVLDDLTASGNTDLQLRTVAHGVIVLEQFAPDYGADRRRLRVIKMRGVNFRGGFHDFTIQMEGLVVYPRLVAADHRHASADGIATSKLPELDMLLGGGLDRGTSTLLMGAAGTGKSTLASQYAVAAAERGERVAIYSFDEGLNTLLGRARGLGLNLPTHVEAGFIRVQQIDPAEMSPGEFAHRVREAVQSEQLRMVIIDSLNGYLNAMPAEKFLVAQLHELLSFLAHHGVVTILVVSQTGLLGAEIEAPVEISYLADTVVLLRYFESTGAVRKAVSVLKKRSGDHERSIRELTFAQGGIHVGPPLRDFQGVLTGMASFRPSSAAPDAQS